MTNPCDTDEIQTNIFNMKGMEKDAEGWRRYIGQMGKSRVDTEVSRVK